MAVEVAGDLVDRVKQAVLNYGAGPESRVVVRIGLFGAEHTINEVKMRIGVAGPELILEAMETPNGQ